MGNAAGVTRSGRSWPSRATILAIALAVTHAALAWVYRTPGVATRSDDAEYIMLAREVAHGRYTDAFNVDELPHARYPPGYPVFLAAATAIGGEREGLFLMLNAVLSAATLFLLLDWARRHVAPTTWLALAPVAALNPETIFTAGTILSESLFAFVVMLALRLEFGVTTGWRAVAATIAASLATIVRSAGLSIASGLIASRIVARRWGLAAALMLTTVATGGLWTWYSARAPEQVDRVLYMGDLLRSGLAGEGALANLWRHLPLKLEAMLTDQLPTALAVSTVPGNWIDNGFAALLIVVLVPVGLYELWRRWRPAAAALLMYGALNVAWPWTVVRYVVPVSFLVLLAMFLGAEFLAARARWRWTIPVVVGGLAVYLTVGAGLAIARESGRFGDCDKGAPYGQAECFPVEGEWPFVQAARFARDSLPGDAVVFTLKAASFYYHSGLRSVSTMTFLRVRPDSLAPALRAHGVEWVVVSNVGMSNREMGRLLSDACGDFGLVRQFDPRTAILRVRPVGAERESGADACAAMSWWRSATAGPAPQP